MTETGPRTLVQVVPRVQTPTLTQPITQTSPSVKAPITSIQPNTMVDPVRPIGSNAVAATAVVVGVVTGVSTGAATYAATKTANFVNDTDHQFDGWDSIDLDFGKLRLTERTINCDLRINRITDMQY